MTFNLFDLDDHTILRVRHGSHAYGLNVATSDEDFRAVCIPPLWLDLSPFQGFEQHESMSAKSGGVDSVCFALKKFVKLAAACNPNIIEILYVAPADLLRCAPEGSQLIGMRDIFLSQLAFNTFSGYALSQKKKLLDRGLEDARARKNAMHLVRLSRMCLEIIRDGEVNVFRKADRDELLAIRNGERSLDSIISETEDLYDRAKSHLPHTDLPPTPNYKHIGDEYQRLLESFHRL